MREYLRTLRGRICISLAALIFIGMLASAAYRSISYAIRKDSRNRLLASPREPLPPEVEQAFRTCHSGEYAGVFGPGSKVLLDYVQNEHWSVVVDRFEKAAVSQQRSHDFFVIAAGCRRPTPGDMADFQEAAVALYEKRKISTQAMDDALGNVEPGCHFLWANCDDPQIRRTLKRAIAACPDQDYRNVWQAILDGDFSDRWWLGGSNSSGRAILDYPEPMPGSLPAFPFKHFLKHYAFWPLVALVVLFEIRRWKRRSEPARWWCRSYSASPGRRLS